MGKFKNSSIRLGRATDHLAAFQAEWNRLAKNQFGSACRHDENNNDWYIASLTASDAVREMVRTTTLPLILGEFAYQLRAALDGLMWDAITFKRGGTEPPADASRIEFPVLNGKIRKFETCGFHDFPFPDALKVFLRSVQPGYAPRPADYPEGLSEALEDVHNLARLDRHRRLRIIASLPTELYADFVFDPPTGFSVVETEGLLCNILGDKYDLMRFKVESSTGDPPTHIRIFTGAKFEVVFEDIPAVKDAPSGTRLVQLRNAVEYVIERFEQEFA